MSPDGQQIAYAKETIKDSGASSEIFIRKGGTDRQVSDGNGDAFLPVWSPDGQWLVYTDQVQGGIEPVFVQMQGGTEIHRFQGLSGQVASWVAANNPIPFQSTPVPLQDGALPTATPAPPEP